MSGSKVASTTIDEERLKQQKCSRWLDFSLSFFYSFVAQHRGNGFCYCCFSKFRKVYHTIFGPNKELCTEFINSFITCKLAVVLTAVYRVAELNILNFDVSPIGIQEQKLLIRLFSLIFFLSFSLFIVTFHTQVYTCATVPWGKGRDVIEQVK